MWVDLPASLKQKTQDQASRGRDQNGVAGLLPGVLLSLFDQLFRVFVLKLFELVARHRKFLAGKVACLDRGILQPRTIFLCLHLYISQKLVLTAAKFVLHRNEALI